MNTKKSYDEAHIVKEWDSDEESSDSDNDGVATVAIKGSCSSSRKYLFPNLNNGKCTCLMAKESKRKVKPKSSSPKYVWVVMKKWNLVMMMMKMKNSLSCMSKNPTAMIKALLTQIRLRDELLEQ
jgi:hypothetical protein